MAKSAKKSMYKTATVGKKHGAPMSGGQYAAPGDEKIKSGA
jgi:hypothetical protein